MKFERGSARSCRPLSVTEASSLAFRSNGAFQDAPDCLGLAAGQRGPAGPGAGEANDLRKHARLQGFRHPASTAVGSRNCLHDGAGWVGLVDVQDHPRSGIVIRQCLRSS
eukprot:s4865_g5.t1